MARMEFHCHDRGNGRAWGHHVESACSTRLRCKPNSCAWIKTVHTNMLGCASSTQQTVVCKHTTPHTCKLPSSPHRPLCAATAHPLAHPAPPHRHRASEERAHPLHLQACAASEQGIPAQGVYSGTSGGFRGASDGQLLWKIRQRHCVNTTQGHYRRAR